MLQLQQSRSWPKHQKRSIQKEHSIQKVEALITQWVYLKSMGFATEERRHTGPSCSSDGELANGNYFCVPLMVKAFVASLKEKYLPRELAELYFIYFNLFYFIFILFDFAPFNKYGAGIPQQHNQLLWSQK